MAGFRSGEMLKIKKALLQKLQQRKLELEGLATNALQNSIETLEVVDTKNLKANSNATVFPYSNGLIIRLKTDGTAAPYWIYPRNGLGTSAAYGPRKYDHAAALEIAAKLKLKRK